MKKILVTICISGCITSFNSQTINNLDFDRRESTPVDFHPFFESISESNRLNDNTQVNNSLFATYNNEQNFSGTLKLQGTIKWRDNSGTNNNFLARRLNNINHPISIVNCTQDGNNTLISGTFYTNYAPPAPLANPIAMSSDGILMLCTNPVNFQHDLVEFNFWSIPGPPPMSPATTNHFVFITDAVKDDVGNTYAVGVVNTNIENTGRAFFLVLDNNLNIIHMRLNQNINATWERVVYDNSNNSIYMVGKGRRPGFGFNPIIARYEIATTNFNIRAFDRNEAFFDIKKDLTTNELVVGWTEGHYHDIGLLFFDDQLNLLSERTWDNHSSLIFNPSGDNQNTSGEVSISSLKPNSLYIGSNEIFIRGSGARTYYNQPTFSSWYANHYYSTSRMFYTDINAAFSEGRYIEHSLNHILFQTMNGIHPWFPKRLVNADNELVSHSDMPHINFSSATDNNALDFLQNYNANPNLTLMKVASTVGCHNLMHNDIIHMNFLNFTEVIDPLFDFSIYTPLVTDFVVHRNQNLSPLLPASEVCNGSSNPGYKLASQIKSEPKITGYKIYSLIGQVIESKPIESSLDVNDFLKTIEPPKFIQKGIYLVQLETNMGQVFKKVLF